MDTVCSSEYDVGARNINVPGQNSIRNQSGKPDSDNKIRELGTNASRAKTEVHFQCMCYKVSAHSILLFVVLRMPLRLHKVSTIWF